MNKNLKKHTLLILLIALLLTSCADFLEPIINTGELKIEAIITTIGYARDVFVGLDHIYIAEDQAGFSIYNKNNELVTQHYGNIENARLINAVDDKKRLFVYDRYGSPASIMVYDITDPAIPLEMPPITGQTSSVEDLICQMKDKSTIDILWTHGNKYQYGNYDDLWLGSFSYDLPNAVGGFAVRDTIIFITGEQRGMYIVNRNNGTIISEVNTTGEALDVSVLNNYAYIADKSYGITVIDISDILNPEVVATHETSGYAQRLVAQGDNLVVASGGGGVYLFDISTPAKPEFIDRWDDSDIGYTYDVEMYDGEVFVATREGVYRMSIIK